jgi:hypothetical protein
LDVSIAALITGLMTIVSVIVGAKWQCGKSKAAQPVEAAKFDFEGCRLIHWCVLKEEGA